MGYGLGPYGLGTYGATVAGGVGYPYEMPPVIAAAPSLSTPQAALDARNTDTRGVLYIGGVLTAYTGGRVSHRLGETATGRITLTLPRPDHVVPNATIEYQSGHNDLVGTSFSGYVPDYDFAMTGRGDTLDLMLVGWKHVLQEPFRDDIVYQGPIAADLIFIDLCERAGVPSYIAEAPLLPSGAPLLLGGNPRIEDGTVTIRANANPIGQFERLVAPFWYYVTDYPMGSVVFHRALGTPAESPVVTFREGPGGHLGDTRRSYVTRDIVNVHDVRGATYEDVYGGEVPIRSIADPATVPANPEVRGGYRYRQQSNSDLVRQDLADGARQALEIETSAADTPVRWEAVAVPGIAPGDCVAVEAETVEASGSYWLVGMTITDEDGGLIADYEARAGAGTPHPGIVDRETMVIDAGVWHGGDEHVSHYQNEAPQGTRKTYPITLPKGATALNVRGWNHSFNSQTVAGEDTTLTVTRWEVWPPGANRDEEGARAELSGTMPHMAERYFQRPNFKRFTTAAGKQPGEDGYVVDPGEWTPFAVALGRLDPGNWELDIACGEGEGIDDGEVRGMYIEIYGRQPAAGA